MLFPCPDLSLRLESSFGVQARQFAGRVRARFPETEFATLELSTSPDGPVALHCRSLPHFSRVWGLGLGNATDPSVIDAAERFAFGRGDECRVELSPLTSLDFREELVRRGYGARGFTNVYIRRPPEPEEDLSISPGIRIERVGPDRPELAGRMFDALQLSFGGSNAPGDPMRRVMGLSLDAADFTAFAAFIAGTDHPIGAGCMECIGDIAHLFGAGTVEEHRNRGGQTGLIRTRLSHVRDGVASGRACDLVVIQTRPGIPSERNILRAGFQLAYSRPQVVRGKP